MNYVTERYIENVNFVIVFDKRRKIIISSYEYIIGAKRA